MAELDLPERQLRQLIELLHTHVPDSEVWAYGSRVSGRNHAASDVDLVVRSHADSAQLGALRRSLAESNLPVLVDVLEWDALPQDMRASVERLHVVLMNYGH